MRLTASRWRGTKTAFASSTEVLVGRERSKPAKPGVQDHAIDRQEEVDSARSPTRANGEVASIPAVSPTAIEPMSPTFSDLRPATMASSVTPPFDVIRRNLLCGPVISNSH